MTFFDCTADLVGQLNGNGQKGMLQIDAPPVENFWLRLWTDVDQRDRQSDRRTDTRPLQMPCTVHRVICRQRQ